MSQAYSPKDIEKKWQDIWDEEKAFRAGEDYSKPKYYALVEFPYPSGQGLHVGHPRPYTALDIIARKNYKAIMYYILWDGTLLVCRRRTMRLKTRSIQRL